VVDQNDHQEPNRVSDAPGSQHGAVSAGAIDLRPPRVPNLTTPRAAGVAGIIFSVLLVASFLSVRFPPVGLDDAETVRWFRDNLASDLTIVGLYLIPFCGIAFLWFIAVIRDRIGRFEDRFFATVFLGTGLLFIAMLFSGLAVAGSLVAGQRFFGESTFPDADLIRSTHSLSSVLIYIYGAKMAGVFVFVTNTIAFRTRVFTRWVALVGYAVGLILLLGVGFNLAMVTVFPAWVVFLSVYILATGSPARGDVEEGEAAF
jgi:hypothetical protein